MFKKIIYWILAFIFLCIWVLTYWYLTADSDTKNFIRYDVNPLSSFWSSVCSYMDNDHEYLFEAQCWVLVVHFASSPSRYQEFKSDVISYLDSQEFKYRVIQDSKDLVSFGFQLNRNTNQNILETIKNDLEELQTVKYVFYNRSLSISDTIQ